MWSSSKTGLLPPRLRCLSPMVFFSYIFTSETVREGDLIKSTAPHVFVEASAIALYDITLTHTSLPSHPSQKLLQPRSDHVTPDNKHLTPPQPRSLAENPGPYQCGAVFAVSAPRPVSCTPTSPLWASARRSDLWFLRSMCFLGPQGLCTCYL